MKKSERKVRVFNKNVTLGVAVKYIIIRVYKTSLSHFSGQYSPYLLNLIHIPTKASYKVVTQQLLTPKIVVTQHNSGAATSVPRFLLKFMSYVK